MTLVLPWFPKIPAYRREADVIHLVRSVVCLEKIDGTSTRIGVPPGALSPDDLLFGGRTLTENDDGFCQPVLRASFLDAPGRSRALFAFAASMQAPLILHGETCGRGIQAQGFIYGPRPHFVLFAATLGGVWLSYSQPTRIVDDDRETMLPSLEDLAARCSLDLVPCLASGPPDSEHFDALLERPSAHAVSRNPGAGRESTHEGIVIWSDPLLLDGAGRPLVAKHKHPSRREAEDAPKNAAESPAEFALRVVLPERVRHAIQHLRVSGRPLDQGAIVKRILQDVAREELSYQEQIARHGKPFVRAALESVGRAILLEHPSLLEEPDG